MLLVLLLADTCLRKYILSEKELPAWLLRQSRSACWELRMLLPNVQTSRCPPSRSFPLSGSNTYAFYLARRSFLPV